MKDCINFFGWLIKYNETLTGLQFAQRIENYSSHPRAQYYAMIARRGFWFSRTHSSMSYDCPRNFAHRFGCPTE